MTSNYTTQHSLRQAQRHILKLVAANYPFVYLVGGTAISLLYRHRISEDLDFFTHQYTRTLHRDIARYLRRETGYPCRLIEEETRRHYVKMAVYEVDLGKQSVLKMDVVSDYAELVKPRRNDGIASLEDIYYRKILAVIGLQGEASRTGRPLAGGRQKTKDLFDIFYVSRHAYPLHEYFPRYFGQPAYERLAAWYLSIPKRKTLLELMALMPRGDAKAIFRHLDEEIIHRLNREYAGI